MRAAACSLVLASLLLSALGCGSSRPEVRHYSLSLTLPTPPVEAPTPQTQALAVPAVAPGKTLVIRYLAVRAPFDRERMVYRSSPYQVDFYNYHQWAPTPGEQVAEWTLRYLRRTGLFAQVVSYPGATGDYVLGGIVREFSEVDHGDRWEAVLGLDFWITRGEGTPPIWSHSYQVTRQASRRNPEATAAAMSENLQQVLKDFSATLPALLRADQPPPQPTAPGGAVMHIDR